MSNLSVNTIQKHMLGMSNRRVYLWLHRLKGMFSQYVLTSIGFFSHVSLNQVM